MLMQAFDGLHQVHKNENKLIIFILFFLCRSECPVYDMDRCNNCKASGNKTIDCEITAWVQQPCLSYNDCTEKSADDGHTASTASIAAVASPCLLLIGLILTYFIVWRVKRSAYRSIEHVETYELN